MPSAADVGARRSAPGKPFHGITLHRRRRAASRDGSAAGPGRGVRRTVLHTASSRRRRRQACGIVHGDVGPVSQDATSVRCGGFCGPLPGGRRRPALADPPARSAWPGRRPARGGGESAGTIRWRRGVTASRCTGPTARRRTSPRSPTSCVGMAILTSHRGGFDEHLDGVPGIAGSAAGSRPRSRPGGRPACGRGCAAGQRDGCCWSVTPPGTSTR